MNCWIDPDKHKPPYMQEVLIKYAGGLTIGWNEALPEEDVSWCSQEDDWTLNERVISDCDDEEYNLWYETVVGWFPIPTTEEDDV